MSRMAQIFFLMLPVMALGLVLIGPDDCPAQEKGEEKREGEKRDTRPTTNPIHAAVRVNGGNSSCGTIIKVEQAGGEGTTAYVLTTGHLQKRMEMKIEVFYRDGKKLEKAEEATGELVCLVENNLRGIDFSVVKVTLKGPPKEYAACKLAKDVPFNKELVSIGCDKGIEPKEFNVTATRWRKKGNDVWVRHKTEESSNGGRSGGGLFRNGELVGVYWGSYTKGDDSEKDLTDRGNGMATSCTAVRKALESLGLADDVLE